MTIPSAITAVENLSAGPGGSRFFVPRPHQVEARDAIVRARLEGRPGFLLGDLTGLGKTLSVWLAVAAMPDDEVLIVCPKGAMPQWRRTILLSGAAVKSVTIINYERTKSLLTPLAASLKRSVRAKNNELAKLGIPKRTWPVVVFDESHRLRNPASQQSITCRRVADAASFAVYLSATAGQSPHELSYLGKLLGHAVGGATDTIGGFRDLMKRLRIGKAKGRWKNWTWEPNDRDRNVMADILYRGADAIGMRRRPSDIVGWPEVQRELAPTALDGPARRLYEAKWREFRRELGLVGGSTRTPTGRVVDIRFRQKASLLRVSGTVEFVKDLLDEEHQVAVSVAFLETGAALAEKLAADGRRVGQINGERDGDANEAARVAFQTGELDVVIFTVTESISLHRDEMPGGGKDRSLVIHDMRHSGIQLQQIEGRCHRDGQQATIYYAFAEGTVEEKVVARVIGRMASMDGMAGDDTHMLDDIARIIDELAADRTAD
ncbi:helicase [Aliidongia dinghuensis]|uniref:Helicase n=1 Tax=Aliidongia dinghuensis TaxID=1867774 RepID=A0A8J3E7B9_9PROT|nr:DEAD/DEAH box helicase family protein [Aliidongia dinghuensis]GGF37729.1 helicase [Aliidongia dinghuensis]